MNDRVTEWITRLEASFRSQRNTGRAEQMAAYMKDLFSFYGIPSENRKAIVREHLKGSVTLSEAEKRNVITTLWTLPHRELHYSAQELAVRWKCFQQQEDINLIKHLITHESWWDTVDFIASNLLGAYMLRYPQQKHIIDDWNRDQNMWLVRATILYQLKYKDATDMKRLEALIQPHVNNKEFFIKKAIGWALRQASKHHPEYVRDMIDRHPLQALSLKEARKYL